MELIIQVSDWPQDRNDTHKDPFPFLSWCGSMGYRDIVWPTYDLMRHTIQGMDRYVLIIIMACVHVNYMYSLGYSWICYMYKAVYLFRGKKEFLKYFLEEEIVIKLD